MSRYLIGLDIGTSAAKGLLVNPSDGSVAATATGEYPFETPHALWAEQDPSSWWTAAKQVLMALARAAGGADEVAGIGLTGQMHGLVATDGAGAPLRPCIMWNDQRTQEECAEITRLVGAAELLRVTGNPVLPGFTAPKILWVRNHEPEVYDRIRHILLPKDYIRFRLTGEFGTDVSDASGMSLLDVRTRDWAPSILRALNIPREWLPAVFESPSQTWAISGEAAAATGLREGTPVFAGGGDQAAGGVGSGIVSAGVISITIGTSGVVFAHSDTLAIEPEGRLHAFCHAVPGAWHLMGVTLAAGGSLRWYRDALCAAERDTARAAGADVYDRLAQQAAAVPPGSDGLLFLPYLSGERTPHPDPHARGAFVGLTLRHGKAHLTRAVMEGVAFSLRDCVELMRGMGIALHDVRLSGGGARSPLWREIIADILHSPVSTVTSTDGGPYGAALLAAVGAGVYSSVQEACRQTIRTTSTQEPVRNRGGMYDELYAVYRSLYPSLREGFRSLSGAEYRQ